MRWLMARTGGWRATARLTGRRVRSLLTPDEVPNGALEAIRALEARSFEAETRLGASSPRVLGAALMRMKPRLYEDRARLLGGIRLWPRGRFFVDGEDIYPQLIADRVAA